MGTFAASFAYASAILAATDVTTESVDSTGIGRRTGRHRSVVEETMRSTDLAWMQVPLG